MNNLIRKEYFDFLFTIVSTTLTILFFAGQIIFLTIGLTVGMGDLGLEDILGFGLGVFGIFVALSLSLNLLAAWKYWAFNSEGVMNVNLFWKTRIPFNEVEYVDEKNIYLGTLLLGTNCLCFHKGKKMVIVPTWCLSEEEQEWLKQQVPNKKSEP